MRILLLTHAFNSLAQRIHVELRRDGHELSVELDIHDRVSIEAVALFAPQLVIAPFLKRAIPAAIWQHQTCFIVHPGPPGDRGPAALDWAILRGLPHWGVTVLQAQAGLDEGPVWAYADFPMRAVRKSSLYRREVADAAAAAVRAAIGRFVAGRGPLPPAQCLSLAGAAQGWQAPLTQAQRAIAWSADDSAAVARKIRASDGFPGVEHTILGRRFRMFDARIADMRATRGFAGISRTQQPGSVLGRGGGDVDPAAVCLATRDGAVWIGQLQAVGADSPGFKQPALLALGPLADGLERYAGNAPAALGAQGDIQYTECGPVGYLRFDFYNGALGIDQCERLRAAYAHARARPTRVIVLAGGADFWCNGMHLHAIEAAASAGCASWENINGIDDLALDIITTESHLTVAALGGNAAAGGVFLALAADHVLALDGVLINAHYRNMGNLFGSEYWTYLLPRRVGDQRAQQIIAQRLPMGAAEALEIGLIDEIAGPGVEAFAERVAHRSLAMAGAATFAAALAAKRARRAQDERIRALAAYRAEELERMRLNFFGFDPSYHVARHRFVTRAPAAWTPLHLARHRRIGFQNASAGSSD
jgi:putative two-component system hydrogenase maturation factor HypX/HoxX